MASFTSAPKILTPEEMKSAIPLALGLASHHIKAQALHTFDILCVADVIGASTMAFPDIVSALPEKVNASALRRCLRLLATPCVGMLAESTDAASGDFAFALTNLGALHQTRAPMPSVACGVKHWMDPSIWNAWGSVPDYVSGKFDSTPFKAVNNQEVFEYAGASPYFAKNFNEFMSFFSAGEIPCVVNMFDWSPYAGKKVVDVGGSLGVVMGAVKEKNPAVHCVSFDLPEVTARCEQPPAGVELASGSFFEAGSIPSCDLIFMKHILHDWNDEQCIEILKNCASALPAGGVVLIADCVLPAAGEDSPLRMPQMELDLLMMLIGGRERTVQDFRGLAAASGFTLSTVTPTPSPACQLVTLTKAE